MPSVADVVGASMTVVAIVPRDLLPGWLCVKGKRFYEGSDMSYRVNFDVPQRSGS